MVGTESNVPQRKAEPEPTRNAILPAAEALLMAVTWAALRLRVLETAPVLELVTEGSLTIVVPTAAQVPFEMTTGRSADALSLTSFRTAAPVPVV
jgi:hypothetical protein